MATSTQIKGTLFLAGGGSGGHIAPGIAIAEALTQHCAGIEPIFLCSNRKVDAEMLDHFGARYLPLPATPPAVRADRLARFLLNHRRSKNQVRSMIRQQRRSAGNKLATPMWMLSLGGFVSVAPAAVAKSERIPLALLNLDAVPGKANRMIARKADFVMTATPLCDPNAIPHRRTSYPVRRDARAPASRDQCCQMLGIDPNRSVLLVTGASQGSRSLNSFMQTWVTLNPTQLDGWQVLHLTGQGPFGSTLQAAYERAGVTAKVETFAHHIGTYWGAADAALSRAGANSVGEAVFNKVPTLFAPYPFHRDQHQKHNAKPVVEAGGALLAEDQVDPEANCATLGTRLSQLLGDHPARARMVQVLTEMSADDGAIEVVRALLDITNR